MPIETVQISDPDPAQGPPPDANLWRDVPETALRGPSDRQIIPRQYRLVEVDLTALDRLLDQAPLEDSLAAQGTETVLVLPLPNGTLGHFWVEESPIMEPALAAQFPEIKTYRGVGLDDPTATARLDRTPAGFHGLILSAAETVYIDPYRRGDILNYMSYFKKDYNNIWGKVRLEESPLPGPARSQGLTGSAVSSNIRRTYRLAVAATGEYTQFQDDGNNGNGNAAADALAAVNTTVNRIVGIYEREFLVKFILVANNNLIIYTNPATDPYSNNNGVTMLGQNQTNLNTVIGSANYDIGHVFSTGGGGVAGLGVVCLSSQKARGVTGSSAPVGDPFDVDFVAHEMGHQFDGNHTFNAGSAGNCDASNRNSSTAYEPGSGSTIMAYAGICPSQDLQPHSDDYFHGISFDEIMAFISDPFAGDSCGTKTTISNAAPSVSAGPAYTIPKGTPFTLTGSASDSNNDALTYDWEEFDLGSAASGSLPNTDSAAIRPIFRSFNPSPSSARTFPQLASILDGTNVNIGESLPTQSRTMQFRLTVRDNKGGVANATTAITVNGSSGPFTVTQPNTALTWTSLTQQNVTWAVAGTTAIPVSCATVNIRLSTDGGSTFSQNLAANTSNDGSHIITVPNIGTTTARIKIECANNIFFDISNANFTINALPVPSLSLTKTVLPASPFIKPVDPLTYTIVVSNGGSLIANDVRVTDTLPSGLSGANLDTLVTVPAGQSVTLILNATVDQNVPENTQITNTAYFSHTSGANQDSVSFIASSGWIYFPIIHRNN